MGRGKDSEWLGSIAWDGYPLGVPQDLLLCSNEHFFREEVARFILSKDDGTTPKDGWPWPWEDSRTTDYAYAFDLGKVWASSFGTEWFDPLGPEPEDDLPKTAEFPDMTDRQNITFGKRSGVLIFSSQKPGED